MFAGGRLSFVTDLEAKTFASDLWATLDHVRDNVANLVLVHGGDSKGVDRLAASWAEQRRVPQVAFSLDHRLGHRAGFRRNERILSLDPRDVVAFAGSGVVERLVFQARQKGICVVGRRGPAGTNPKFAARVSARLGAPDNLLFLPTVRADAVTAVEVAGRFQRHRDAIGLLVAEIHCPGDASVAQRIGPALADIVVQSLCQMHGNSS